MLIMRIVGLAAVVGAVAAAGGAAKAQVINPFGSEFVVTKGDLAAIDAAVDPLLLNIDAALGAEEKWANAESGASGSVALVRIHDKGAFTACRTLRYDVVGAGSAAPRRFFIDYCRAPDGRWKSFP